jgi:hypothetical protein
LSSIISISSIFQQFLPHLSSSDERAIVIVNKDGDFAIVKGRWTGFLRKIPGDKGMKAKPGNPGKLQVDAFNLLKNTVQKFELPGAEGSTLFVVGGEYETIVGCIIINIYQMHIHDCPVNEFNANQHLWLNISRVYSVLQHCLYCAIQTRYMHRLR